MKNKFLNIINLYWPKFLSLLFFVVLSLAYMQTFAIGSPYAPGATLDPACAASEANCTVSVENALTFSTGLTRATNTITNNLSTGVSGGQSVIGGTASGNNLTLSSTSDSTKGKLIFGSLSAYDEVNDRLGLGTTSPQTKLEVVGDIISKGTSWTSRTSASDLSWNDVAYGNGIFVAVGSNGSADGTGTNVMTSPDGINWTLRTSSNNSWQSVAYGNGLFVAVSTTGTNKVMTSPDGITWTVRTATNSNFWNDVAYGNGTFVAVASTGTGDRAMTSPDGITWTTRNPGNYSFNSIIYGNGTFVAVTNDSGVGNQVFTSPDGITWTSRTSAADNAWSAVTYGNGLFVAVSYTGSGNRVMTSPDGITWTSRTSAANNNWFGITYGNGLFVAVSSNGSGNRIMTSSDGITWTSRSNPVANSWYDVTYGNGIFVAVAISGSGNRVMTSGLPELSSVSYNNLYQGGLNVYGSVGIGNTSPSYTLHVGSSSLSGIVARFQNSTGTCDVNPTTTSLSCSSDYNLKTNISNLDQSRLWTLDTNTIDQKSSYLSRITSLKPVKYTWKGIQDDTLHAGFIAQEVESIFPDLVMTDPITGLKSLNYIGLSPYIVESIREMNLNITNIDNFERNNIWRDSLISWFANSTNHITRIFTGEICLTSGGDKECLNKEELRTLKTLINTQTQQSLPTASEDNPTVDNTTTDTTEEIQESPSTDHVAPIDESNTNNPTE